MRSNHERLSRAHWSRIIHVGEGASYLRSKQILAFFFSAVLAFVTLVAVGNPAKAATYVWSITAGEQQGDYNFDDRSDYWADGPSNVIDARPDAFPGYPLACADCLDPTSNKVFTSYIPEAIWVKQGNGARYQIGDTDTNGAHYGYRSYQVTANGEKKWYPALCVDKQHQHYEDTRFVLKKPYDRNLATVKLMSMLPMSKDDPMRYDFEAIRSKYGFGSREGNYRSRPINRYDNQSNQLIADAVEAASWHLMDDNYGWWIVDLSNATELTDGILGYKDLPESSVNTSVAFGTTMKDYPQLAPRLDASGNATMSSKGIPVGLMFGARSDNSNTVKHGLIPVKNAKEFPTVVDGGYPVNNGALWTWDKWDSTPYPMDFTNYWRRGNPGVYASGNILRLSVNDYSAQQVIAAYNFYRDLVEAVEKDKNPTLTDLTGFSIEATNLQQEKNANGTYNVEFTVEGKTTKPQGSDLSIRTVSSNYQNKLTQQGNKVVLNGLTAEDLRNAYVTVDAVGKSLGHAVLRAVDGRNEESRAHQLLMTFKQVPMTVTASRTFRFTPEAAAASLQTTISAEGASAASLATPTAGAVAANLDLKGTDSDFVDSKQVPVKDTVTLSDFDESKNYQLFGVLKDVTADKFIASGSTTFKGDVASVDVELKSGEDNPTLEVGHKYVVFEFAYPEGKAPVSDLAGVKGKSVEYLSKDTDSKPAVAVHADENDQAQTLIVAPQLKTKVQAGDTASAAGQAALVQANQEVTVTDTVTLAGLDQSAQYKLLGTLVDITDVTKPQVVASTVSKDFAGSAKEQQIEFDQITPKAGHTYVVYEYLYKADSNVSAMTPGAFDSKNVPAGVLAKHQDNSDQDQMLVTGGTLATTVTAGTTTAVAASDDQPAQAAQISLGADDKAAVAVTDTVQVTGLNFANSQKYDLVGVLKDVTAGQFVAFGTTKVTANGQVTVPLYADAVQKTNPELQAGHKYVVFEFAYPAYPEGKAPVSDLAGVKGKSVAELSKPAVAVHADEKDQAQTIVVAPKIATQVMVNGQTGSGGAPLLVLPDGKAVTAKDTVQLTGLTAGGKYQLLGVLVDLKPAKSVVVAAGTTAHTANGTAAEETTVELGSLTPEKDHTYVVFEYLYSGDAKVTAPATGTDFDAAKLPAGALASHSDQADVKQMITTGGTLATTVSAGSGDSKVTATATKAATVTAGTAAEVTTPVVDTVKYLNFEKGATYTIVGELMDVTTGIAVSTGITANKLLQPTEGSGSVELDFGQVKLKAGHKYVAFETAFIGTDTSTTSGKVFAEHKNPADTQQTIVVTPKLATTLQQQGNLQNTNPVQVAAGKVTVVDTVALQGLSLNKQYVLQGQLVDEKGQPVGEVVTSKPFAGTGDAAQTQDLVFPEITVAAGQKLVAFETLYVATEQGQPDKEAGEVANHKDLSDKAQTVIAGGELRTTVSAGDKTAGTTAAQVTGDSTAKVVDTVTYTGFAAGTTYDLVGVLVEVDAAGKTVAVVAAAQGEFTGKGAAAGTAQIDFGDVQLAAGKKYVVHEYTYARTSADTPAVTAAEVAGIKTPAAEILPGKLLVASHADNTDQAQTIVASPLVLRTTVTAAGETAKADAAAFVPFVGESKIPVTDQVELKGLPAGTEYTVVGLLKDLSSGKYVAVGTTTVKDQTQATVTLKDLAGQDPQIEPGKKYVVHEFLYEGKVTTPTQLEVPTGAVAKHENDKDQAQTFVVGAAPQLKTEVVAGTTTGDLDKNLVAVLEDGGKVDVSDRIVYEGLQPGKQYQVTGRLMQLGQDGERFASPKEVAVTTVTLTAAASGSGEWTVKFAEPVAIEAGGIYVVFEQAVPLDQDGKPVEAQTLKHENPNDYPQVIVVKTPEGEIPEIPGDGGGFFPPPGNVPNQGGESSTPTPTKTSGTTVPVTSPAEPENPGKPQIPGWVKWLIPMLGIPALGMLVAPVVQRAVQQPAPAPAPAPAVSAPAAAAPSSTAAPTTVKRPLLAMTGANVIWLLVIALVLIGLGAVLVMRRRRES